MDTKTHLRTVLSVVALIVLVQCAIGYGAYILLPDWTTRGQFGDVFGAANALFSGLAFAGLIYAILLQREDLVLQRTELELTRQELKRSASAQEQSEVALRAQAAAASQSARMAAISFLLQHYQSELDRWRQIALPVNDPRVPRIKMLEDRKRVLLEMLDAMFNEVSANGDEDDAVQNR